MGRTKGGSNKSWSAFEKYEVIKPIVEGKKSSCEVTRETGVGTPTDNSIIESLNGWLKEEMAKDFNLYKSKDVHKTVKDYIYYFNNERLAYSLNYKSPIQYRTELSFK